jgi:D-3-phosphoglycerate dehydrogenase/glyoxylate/hydroxypyruvate reductase A
MSVLIMSKPIPHEGFVSALRDSGFPHPVHTSLDDVDPLSVRWLIAWRLPAGVLPKLPNLELLYCCAAGADKLLATPDLPASLPVSRVSDDAQAIELAQYVVHAALDHLRLAPLYRAQQAARDWSRHRSKSMGIPALVLGLGPIGVRIAQSLAMMGFEVSGWSRTPRELPGMKTYAGADGLAQALPRAKVLVCALPLTVQTTGIINADLIAKLPRGAIFVNIGRGGQVIEADLIAALESGQLGGASIDVQVNEPMAADDPLWTAPNLSLTPHVGGQLDPAAVIGQFIEAVDLLKQGKPLRQRVDAARGY